MAGGDESRDPEWGNLVAHKTFIVTVISAAQITVRIKVLWATRLPHSGSRVSSPPAISRAPLGHLRRVWM